MEAEREGPAGGEAVRAAAPLQLRAGLHQRTLVRLGLGRGGRGRDVKVGVGAGEGDGGVALNMDTSQQFPLFSYLRRQSNN